jgi:hypothetical protein
VAAAGNASALLYADGAGARAGAVGARAFPRYGRLRRPAPLPRVSSLDSAPQGRRLSSGNEQRPERMLGTSRPGLDTGGDSSDARQHRRAMRREECVLAHGGSSSGEEEADVLTCDWCRQPIYKADEDGWADVLELSPFHAQALGRSGGHRRAALAIHVHHRSCGEALVLAIHRMLREHEPAEEDGPQLSDDGRSESIDSRRERAWDAIPTAERDRLVLEHLGDDRLTIRELHRRMEAALPDCCLYEPYVRSLVMRLFRERELDRVGERYRKGDSIRYRYFKRPLEGPIADLERAFHEPSEADEGEGEEA